MSEPLQSTLFSGFAVTPADVEKWERLVAGLDAQAEQLAQRRAVLTKRIEAAKTLFALMDEGEQKALGLPPGETGSARKIIVHPIPLQRNVRIVRDGTFVDAVSDTVQACELGISLQDLRHFIQGTALGPKLIHSDKGFYHAISRLTNRGVVFRKNGRVFSKDGLERLSELEAQGWVDEPPEGHGRSPLREAILEFVAQDPGLVPGDVVRRLMERPEFAQQLTPRNTVAYNTINDLVEQGRLEKRGKELFLPASGVGE